MKSIILHWDISDIWDENIQTIISFIDKQDVKLFGDYHTDNYWSDLYITLEGDNITTKNINLIDEKINTILTKVRIEQNKLEEQE